MAIKNAKVRFDGSHYIAIDSNAYPKRKRRQTKPCITAEKEVFDKAYKESKTLSKRERERHINEALDSLFETEEKKQEFIARETQKKNRNHIVRRMRLWRKINLQHWDYFCTFTYADSKHTEDSFRNGLTTCLRHLASRKAWKYIGVWERGGNTERLHFHGIFVIPQMIGELIEVTDYDTKHHKMQKSVQNTHFNERFGRSDFKVIGHRSEVAETVKYIIKYIEKTGEKIVYSRGLPMYFHSDIFSEDIICFMDEERRKAVLADDFMCMVDGELMGKVSPEVIEKMPKSN